MISRVAGASPVVGSSFGSSFPGDLSQAIRNSASTLIGECGLVDCAPRQFCWC